MMKNEIIMEVKDWYNYLFLTMKWMWFYLVMMIYVAVQSLYVMDPPPSSYTNLTEDIIDLPLSLTVDIPVPYSRPAYRMHHYRKRRMYVQKWIRLQEYETL